MAAKETIPSLFTCESCGANNFSPHGGTYPTRIDAVSKKLVRQICACGGHFKFVKPLFVYKPKPNAWTKLLIFHKKCNAKFRRYSPGCFRCMSCQELGFVRNSNSEVWFKCQPEELTISYG